MKIQELRQMTETKLNEELIKAREELFAARFKSKTGVNQDTSRVTKLRKMIAQILTLINEIKLKLTTKTSAK